MSDETHLAKARRQLNDGYSCMDWGSAILAHLEQQSAPPEAAPERATRTNAEGLDDRCNFWRAQHGRCTFHKGHSGPHLDPCDHEWPNHALSPSAVQGEERTAAGVLEVEAMWALDAVLERAHRTQDEYDTITHYLKAKNDELGRKTDALLEIVRRRAGSPEFQWVRDIALPVLTAEDHERPLDASFSPTATAQRGEPVVGYGGEKWHPLPAQTEPGKCVHLTLRPSTYRYAETDRHLAKFLHMTCNSCGRQWWFERLEGEPTPTQPSPAPECAHVWVAYQRQLEAVRRGEHIILHCKLCDDSKSEVNPR